MAVAHNCRPTRMMSQTLRLFAALAWLCPADAVTFSTVGPDQGTTLYSGGSYAGLYAGAAAVGTTVYFAPDNTDKIGVLDTLTSGWSFIHTDLAGEEMYWTDRTNDRIQKARFDGTGVADVVTTGLRDPTGIALDRARVAKTVVTHGELATAPPRPKPGLGCRTVGICKHGQPIGHTGDAPTCRVYGNIEPPAQHRACRGNSAK